MNMRWLLLAFCTLLIAPPVTAGTLVNLSSKYCLDTDGKAVNGVVVRMWKCASHPNQTWTAEKRSSNQLRFVNSSSHLCLDTDGRKVNGGTVRMWKCADHPNQLWEVSGLPDNRHRLKNKASGLCLDTDGRAANGGVVRMWECATHPNQSWLIDSKSIVGKTIVPQILPSKVPATTASANDRCEDQLPQNQCWKTQDVIDGRIDTHAQEAMFTMFKKGGNQASDASAMLCAVKRGLLEGIHLPDQQVPALRAEAAGSGWWKIIPSGQISVCYKEPAGEKPLIAFSKKIKNNKDSVAQALSAAWKSCGVKPTTARCYVATMSKPPEPQPPSGIVEGHLTITVLYYGARPVSGAKVEVKIGSGITPPFHKLTDSAGVAKFDLTPGQWDFEVIADSTSNIGVLSNAPEYEIRRAGSAEVISGQSTGVVVNLSTQPALEECHDAVMYAEFQRKTDFCAAITLGRDTICTMGPTACDVAKPIKLGCSLFEKIFGKEPPGGKHPKCSVSRAAVYEECVVSTVHGSRNEMSCYPGTPGRIRARYRAWPDRVK